jgi:hypothetical protein
MFCLRTGIDIRFLHISYTRMCYFLWVTWYVTTFLAGKYRQIYNNQIIYILLPLVHIQSQMRGWRFMDVARPYRSSDSVLSNMIEHRQIRA